MCLADYITRQPDRHLSNNECLVGTDDSQKPNVVRPFNRMLKYCRNLTYFQLYVQLTATIIFQFYHLIQVE